MLMMFGTQFVDLKFKVTHSVIPEGATLRVGHRRAFGTPGGLQVEVVVEVTRTESRLQESRGAFSFEVQRSKV